MNVHISENWHCFIRDEIRSGRFQSAGQVLDEALRLLKERGQTAPEPARAAPAESPAHKPIWEVFQEITAGIPEEEWAKVPVDSAQQLDHYIHGTPKRPTP